MSLVKWFRKNNTKVMAVVVIILMIAFIGGSSLQYFLRGNNRLHQTVAYYGNKNKITNYDLYIAGNELDILRMLKTEDILRMLQVPLFKTPDLQAFFMSELLFSDQKTPPAYINYIRRAIAQNQYNINEKQLNDIHRRTIPGDSIYWYCLKNEAKSAGIRVTNEDAGRLLGQIIPQLFNNRTYPQIITSIVNRNGITEQKILETFSELLSVMRYAHLVCSGQDITTRQLMQMVAWEQEKMDVKFVEFNSKDFVRMQDEPEEEQMTEHFNKYKKYFSGDISEENPYGFGYKLPERVRLEYLVLKLDEVEPIVKDPTQDEIEEFYNRNKEQLFKEQVRSDPNDPNSPLKERIKTFASVVNIISKQLKQEKIKIKAEGIIQEATNITELSLEDVNEAEFAKLSTEELAKMAGDYKTAADKISQKYNIKVYTGKTGTLSAIDMQTDDYLSRLYIQSYGQNPVSLTKVVFAIDELAVSELGPYEAQAPKMYINIGPAKDMLTLRGELGEFIALFRVTQAMEAAEPESLDATFDKESIVLDPNDEETDESVYVVKEKVAEDLKKLAAFETAGKKANEFIESASKQGWDETIKKYNEMYANDENPESDDPNTSVAEDIFDTENLTGLHVIPKEILETMNRQNDSNPASKYFAIERKRSSLLVKQLYSLVPSDSNSVDTLPLVMEFKPDMCFFCIKDIEIERIWKEDFDKIKAIRLYTKESVESQSLAAVHFNPENILKRMKFRLVKVKETTDTNTPTGSEEAS